MREMYKDLDNSRRVIDFCRSLGMGVNESIRILGLSADFIRKVRMERSKRNPDTPLDEEYLEEVKSYCSSNDTSSFDISKLG